MQWMQHTPTESLLKSLGIAYRFEPALPMGQLNLSKSLMNNARIATGPLSEEVVLAYAIAMEQGNDFPAIVVHRNGKGFLIDDGNHRVRGFTESGLGTDDSTVGAYVMETDDEFLLDLARRKFNRLNGLQQSREEAIRHAVQMIGRYPTLSHREAAIHFGITESAVRNAIKGNEVREALCRRKVRGDLLSPGVLVALGRLAHDEVAMALLGDMAVDFSLSTKQVEELVVECRALKSEAERVECLRVHEQEFERRNPKKIGATGDRIKAQFSRSMSCLLTIVSKNPSLEHLHLTSDSDRLAARETWFKIKDQMELIFP